VKGIKGKHSSLLFLISLGVLFLAVACGIKGPPKVSRAVVPPAVKDLKAEVVGRDARLTWSVPQRGHTAFEGIVGFKVFRSRALDSMAPCPGCPIAFFEHLDMKLEDARSVQIENGRVVCHVVVEPGRRYAYKVVAYDKNGCVSEDSNTVEVKVQ
jgi:hypothetical protein